MTNFELNKEFLNDPWITKSILQFILSDIIDTQNGIFESEKQVYEYLTIPAKNKSVEIFYELMSNKNINSMFNIYQFYLKKNKFKKEIKEINNFKKQFNLT